VERFKHLIPAIREVVLGDVTGRQFLTQLSQVGFELLDRGPKLTTEPAKNSTDDRNEYVK
jgi:hypothetical protein